LATYFAADNIALAAVMFCVIVSMLAARLLMKGPSEIFTGVGLYALSWLTLLGYYLPHFPDNPFYPLIGSFLGIWVGWMLCVAAERAGKLSPLGLSRFVVNQGFSLVMAIILLTIPVITQETAPDKLLYSAKLEWYETATTALGLLSLLFGIVLLYRGRRTVRQVAALMFFAVVVVVKMGYEVSFTWWYVHHAISRAIEMPDHYKVGFAILKVVETVTFLALVIKRPQNGVVNHGPWWRNAWKGFLEFLFGKEPQQPEAGTEGFYS